MKLTFTLFLFLLITQIQAQRVVFEDNFNDYDPFTISDFGDWTTIDNDGYTCVNIDDRTYANQGSPQAFTAFNRLLAADPLGTLFEAFNGYQFALSFGATSSGGAVSEQNDDWLISPAIDLTTTDLPVLKFHGKTLPISFFGDAMVDIWISTTDTQLNSFTKITSSSAQMAISWTPYEYDLSSYVGETIYIAFQHVSTDAFALGIDNVQVIDNNTNTETTSIWFSGLDDTTDFTFTNTDGDAHNWYAINNAALLTNFGFVAPVMASASAEFDSTTSTWSPLTPDNLLITPSITIPNDSEIEELTFSYKILSLDDIRFAENYTIYVYDADLPMNLATELYNETFIQGGFENGQPVTKLVNVSIPLSYIGKNIKMVVRHHNSTDLNNIYIDNLEVSSTKHSSLGINEVISGDTVITLYPNPTKNHFTINHDSVQKVILFNILGKKVLETENKNTIDISQLEKGIYLVNILAENINYTKKLVINK